MDRDIYEIRKALKKVDADTFKSGDYVFACKWSDADPFDRWKVDYIDTVSSVNGRYYITFKSTGVIPYNYAVKIRGKEGNLIIDMFSNAEYNKEIK